MTDCLICQQAAQKIGLLWEDDDVIALFSPTPAAPGHILVLPKEHLIILEQVPDWVMAKMFTIANKLSIALFEGGGAQGTNIIIPNGPAAGQSVAHTALHIIPRNGGDGLNLDWQPKQISPEEMDSVELKLKEQTKTAGTFITEKPEHKPLEAEKPAELDLSDEENELIKSLKRLP